MPHVTTALFERMVARTNDDIDAVGIRIDGLPEPLVCVLRVSVFLPLVQVRLAKRELKASRLLSELPARIAWLDEADVDRAALRNVNVPDDL